MALISQYQANTASHSTELGGLRTRPAMPLCDTCRSFFNQICTFMGATSHHTTISGFLLASQEGCYICRRLFNVLSDEQRECLHQLDSAVVDRDFAVTHVELMEIPGERSTPSFIHLPACLKQQHRNWNLRRRQRYSSNQFGDGLGWGNAMVTVQEYGHVLTVDMGFP